MLTIRTIMHLTWYEEIHPSDFRFCKMQVFQDARPSFLGFKKFSCIHPCILQNANGHSILVFVIASIIVCSQFIPMLFDTDADTLLNIFKSPWRVWNLIHISCCKSRYISFFLHRKLVNICQHLLQAVLFTVFVFNVACYFPVKNHCGNENCEN